MDIFVHHTPSFLARGGVRLLLRLFAFQPCIDLHYESDELYILDSKSLLLWERSRYLPTLHKRNTRILILFYLLSKKSGARATLSEVLRRLFILAWFLVEVHIRLSAIMLVLDAVFSGGWYLYEIWFIGRKVLPKHHRVK